jgi:hypothetical protein
MPPAHGLLDYPELHLFLEGLQDALPVDLVHVRLRLVVH